MQKNSICYWCGEEVKTGEGNREHLVPFTMLQDLDGTTDTSNLILPKENVHKKCNKYLANNYEHDFCQMIFMYGFGDINATKHNLAKIKNLENKKIYLKNQFGRMKKSDGKTTYQPTVEEDNSFNQVVRKIVKGLYFKNNFKFLDLESTYTLEIDRDTQNLEKSESAKQKVIKFLNFINDIDFIGNEVFKYRYKQAVNGKSTIWELLFYNRFPIHCYLIHKEDEYAFK